ncbi:MAG: hypothetical protein J6Q94_09215 [Clostridia bacterium]|nr:hypothetical protein [Clostridia bacterium]
MWYQYLFLSVASLIAIVLFAVVYSKTSKGKKKKISIFNFVIFGVLLASFFMFMPIHIVTGTELTWWPARAVILSIFNAVQIFALGSEFAVVTDSMSYCPDGLSGIYQIWVAIIFIVAPILTFGFVLSMFKNLSAQFRYRTNYFKDVYVFSELNEKSIALAKDLKKNNKKSVIVFTDVFEANEERSFELAEDARKIKAICFKKDLLAVGFQKHSPNAKITIFAIGENEEENLNQALKIIEQYRERDNTELFVFSTRIESELLINAADRGKVRVRRINEIQSLINRLLYDNGESIFTNSIENEDGVKEVSAVVIGMGRQGTEMVKALSWFGQMDGYHIEINAFDKDKLAEEKFVALAPELMAPEYNGALIDGEAQYKINIYSGYDVETISFAKKIQELKNTTYVFVTLGDDNINIQTAVNLRMLFKRIGIHPVIQAIVYNTQQKNALKGIRNFKGTEYDIEFIGDLESCYSENVILDSELVHEALQRHLGWGTEDEFWNFEYNYRSSVASAIHLHTRIKLGMPGANKKESELTEEEKLSIEDIEHRRWNAYMRSEGYVHAPERNDLAKQHHNLVNYSELSDKDKRKDSQVGTLS